MAYPKKLLNDYETVALDLHPHWWYFAGPVMVLVGSIVLGIVTLASFDGDVKDTMQWVSLIAIVLSALWVVSRYMKWTSTNFVITSDRVIFRQGVLSKHGIEIPLERVNNVLFHQSVFERMLGAGDLLIESGGEDGQQRFTDVRHPEKVQKLIHSQMEANESRMGNRHPAANDVAGQLEKLEGLLERGTISNEEFEAQKRKLLS